MFFDRKWAHYFVAALFLLVVTLESKVVVYIVYQLDRKIFKDFSSKASVTVDDDDYEDVDIQQCFSIRQTMQQDQTQQLANLSSTLLDLNERMAESIANLATSRARRNAEAEGLLAEWSRLQQSFTDISLEIERKYDCHMNQDTIKSCTAFCSFPYGYDSCYNTTADRASVKRRYVRALAPRTKAEHSVISGSYKEGSSGRHCEIYGIVTMASMNLDFPDI